MVLMMGIVEDDMMNIKVIMLRLMAHYLRKNNWVAFYLDPRIRECDDGVCWLKLYENEMDKELSDAKK